MIFGGYSLYLQKTGVLDIAGILEEKGQSEAVAAIAYVLAGTTTKSIGRKQ